MQLRLDPMLRRILKWGETHPGWLGVLMGAWLLFIVWIAFLWNLGQFGLVDETEPLFVEAARQMTLTGDWVTPYFNGVTRFDKPPLVYWLMAIAFQAIGVNAWAARLPSALSALVLVGFVFFTLRHFGQPRPVAFLTPDPVLSAEPDRTPIAPVELSPDASTPPRQIELGLGLSALIGATLMTLHPETIGWARIAVSDMLLSGCMGSALLAFFLAYAQPQRSRLQALGYLGFYVGLGLGVLAKGPVGIVLPGLIVVAFLLYVGQWRAVWREMYVLPGSLIFLAIAVPWYVLVIRANGDAYIDSFFGYHNFERFTSVVNNHSAPWYFYFLVVLLGFTPWAVYLPLAIARLRVWRWVDWRAAPRQSHLGIFALIWFGVIFSFFTIAATKLPSYVLPLMPAAAILCGLLWSDRLTYPRARDRALAVSGIVNLVFLLALAIIAPYSPRWMDDDPAMPNLPMVVRASGIMINAAIIWGTAAIAGGILLLQRQARWLWVVNAIAMVAFIGLTVMPGFAIMDSQRQLHLRTLATTIQTIQQPQEEIVMVGFQKPSVVFYSQQPVMFIKQTALVGGYVQERLNTNQVPSLLLIGRSTKLQEVELPNAQMTSIQAIVPYELVRITPAPSLPNAGG